MSLTAKVTEALVNAGFTVRKAEFLVISEEGDPRVQEGDDFGYEEWEYDRQAALTITGGTSGAENYLFLQGSRSVDDAVVFGPDRAAIGTALADVYINAEDETET